MRPVPSASLTLDQSRGRGTEVRPPGSHTCKAVSPTTLPGTAASEPATSVPAREHARPRGEPPRRAAPTARPAVTRERAARTPAASTRAVWSPDGQPPGAERPCRQLALGGTGTEPATAPASSSLGTRSQTPRWRPETGDSSGTKQTGLSLCTRSYDSVMCKWGTVRPTTTNQTEPRRPTAVGIGDGGPAPTLLPVPAMAWDEARSVLLDASRPVTRATPLGERGRARGGPQSFRKEGRDDRGPKEKPLTC